ncbi:transport energizing protein, ExbD/TolR family [Leptospira ryugenii]|uniref:Transport energizing protein, ExbD/TolR family n=1 Tax=Leptospira ryugenii TaxID=1917863 RepID=A0A2P2E562_9LEPT|nr:biopolymer transporter ExbD [Leptospira ryugenii]GBF52010.1 transport energizing protein, ExbD/TolR family [Leptospira ryugenii]
MSSLRRKRRSNLDLSSLLDILFILLIFLMLSVRFTDLHSFIELDLPSVESQSLGDQKSRILISIKNNETFFLNQTELEKDLFYKELNLKISADNKMMVVLELEKKVPFYLFLEVSEFLKKRGVNQVQILTKNP